MFIAGAKYLESKKKYVDELNVFPVPDGDTGTNMTLTILAAVRDVQKVDSDDLQGLAKAISSGSLRGARGNSGVILSQLFRGFCKEISSHDVLDAVVLANALQRGSETAYKAVMKPKEGTILTVAREAAEKAVELARVNDDIVDILKKVIVHAEATLQYTPELLPVLKQAGVVDSGGQGLMYILRGALMALEAGDDYVVEFEEDDTHAEIELIYDHSGEEIKFGYCTEFIINVRNDMESDREALALRTYLETIGDSIVAVSDEDIIKIHVHTNDPGLALQKGLSIGELSNLKIDNMREEHANRLIAQEELDKLHPTEVKENGFVVISIGDGLSEIFKGLGADYIVEGGQTMNPSTEDILNAVSKVNAKSVFILPNNKNIILAAEQVKDIVDDKQVIVIPTKSIPEGISALINFEEDKSPKENQETMTQAINDVVSGQVTHAIRDTVVDEKIIKEGDFLGIGKGKINVVEADVEQAVRKLFESLIDEDSELISVYYGMDVDEATANQLSKDLEETYPNCEIEVHYGGQPLYYYILSLE
ncbi:DAK2 domain-containing protein [Petrocella sp. FN5]|uniref:DAK2 domain-containing protein n=1 Tax=Petrocella sp. FN5 TaxID=3032002 RepID=UPI0023DCB50A|nr:DAK2 domain-containing protein [Petrocella sp. FN5]MDF1616406.1 DAK2 domain-containing protein [Petrocella sp. FN5]